MAYVKAVFVGLVGAFLACALWIVGAFVVPLMLPMISARLSNGAGGGVGMSVAYISSGPLLVVAIIGFATGFIWRLRRSRYKET